MVRAPPAFAQSVAKGDVVLCNLPPYSTLPWLSMGVVLHHALLEAAGIRARVIRPIPPPFAVPKAVDHASLVTFTFDPPMAERMDAMQRAYRETPHFFDQIVDALLAGSEEVVALSLFRNNADVSLFVARLVKEQRPSVAIILGGPEAIEEPAALLLPWVDAVAGANAEAVIVPLVRAFLDRHPERAATLPDVWLNHSWSTEGGDPAERAAFPTPSIPTIDYGPLMPLFVGDEQATVPLLLNWGCPYNCSFCSNRSIYRRFTAGSVDRAIDEMDGVVSSWKTLHGGQAPAFTLQLSDATTNALPAQFDDLLRAVARRRSQWGRLPLLRGQTLFDTRITEERVELMGEANFTSMFFGLDSADDGLRRSLQKPGSMTHVAAAMEVYHRGGRGGLSFGVPIGIPGETEASFEQAERFVEWALTLEGTIDTITVLPYLFFLSAQDPSLAQMNHGERRGVLWRAKVPGGDPAERARRMMRMFERIGNRAPANSPVPPYLALPAMLPDEDPSKLDAWMDRYGRVFDQITPVEEQGRRVRPEAPAPALKSPLWMRAEHVLSAGPPRSGWVLLQLEWQRRGHATDGLAALFGRADSDERLAVLLEGRDETRKAFARTRDFNVSYLTDWHGQRCSFDALAVRHFLAELARAEALG